MNLNHERLKHWVIYIFSYLIFFIDYQRFLVEIDYSEMNNSNSSLHSLLLPKSTKYVFSHELFIIHFHWGIKNELQVKRLRKLLEQEM